MLLELTRWLEQLQGHFNLFNYLTFRAILAALTSLALSLWWGPRMIRYLATLKGGQPIRKDGPQSHFSKAGTPTMGGALILASIAATVLLWSDLRNKYVWVVLVVMLGFGAIGWADDWIKIATPMACAREPSTHSSRFWVWLRASTCLPLPTWRRRPRSTCRCSSRLHCRWQGWGSLRLHIFGSWGFPTRSI